MIGFFRKILARTAPEKGQGSADELVKLLSEHTADVIARIGPDDRILYISGASTAIFGRTPEEMVGQLGLSFILEEDLPIIAANAERFASGVTAAIGTRLRVRRPDGSLTWVEANIKSVPAPPPSTQHELLLILRDVTERQAIEAQMEALALEDGLTGLANRRAFDQALDREWRRTVREQSQMALILIDADNFKSFNDQYGHQVGDDCLRALAAAIKGCLQRPGDLAARYGGEELVVILPDTDPPGAAAIAERIRLAVEALGIPHDHNDAAARVTISLGVAAALARVGGTMRMPEGLLQAADAALYRAKSNGRNRVESALLLVPPDARQTG